MKRIYQRIFDSDEIDKSRPVTDVVSMPAIWLDPPGCVFQRNDVGVPKDLRTDGIVEPGLYLSIVLQGRSESGPIDGPERHYDGDNQMIAVSVREPTRCVGDAPRGKPIRAISVAYPLTSLVRLGLAAPFDELVNATDGSVTSMRLRAPPRIQAIAAEMLSPMIDSHLGELLLRAQATEILARSLFVLRHQINFESPIGDRTARIKAVKALMQSDLRYPWSIAELTRRAGASRRTLDLQFRATYGVGAIEYLRTMRLEAAREALVYQNVSVSEAAYHAGYVHPANFATAFKQHFGVSPSKCRDMNHARRPRPTPSRF